MEQDITSRWNRSISLRLKFVLSPKMKTELIRNINQAFLHLEFTIKLLTYMERRTTEKDEFDTNIIITGKKRNISFNDSAFNTYDDLILGAENCVLIAVGFSAIVLDTSLKSAGKKADPNDQSSEGMLINLIYMIRCAYAHDMMHPKWKVNPNYAQPLEIQLQNDILRLYLSKKQNQLFKIEDIGGYENYFEIKDLTCKIIS